MVLGFDQRCAGKFQVAGELRRAEASESLGNRPWSAARRSPDLFAEFEILGSRWFGNECINASFQLVGQLPAHQFSIVSCDHERDAGISRAEPRTPNPEPGTPNSELRTQNPELRTKNEP